MPTSSTSAGATSSPRASWPSTPTPRSRPWWTARDPMVTQSTSSRAVPCCSTSPRRRASSSPRTPFSESSASTGSCGRWDLPRTWASLATSTSTTRRSASSPTLSSATPWRPSASSTCSTSSSPRSNLSAATSTPSQTWPSTPGSAASTPATTPRRCWTLPPSTTCRHGRLASRRARRSRLASRSTGSPPKSASRTTAPRASSDVHRSRAHSEATQGRIVRVQFRASHRNKRTPGQYT
mmetsp:Transcript_8853/g.28342  ORF Transcript_8853/g.28342 Transcript_8853/m.28342 type:complete len:238 (-) Transcript_8853:23-736(-)